MALPTSEELQSLLTELTNVVQNYSTAPDLAGYMSRVEVIAKAKKITQAVVAPEQLPNYHGLNVCFSHAKIGALDIGLMRISLRKPCPFGRL